MLLLPFSFLKLDFMCLVVKNGEIKKSCCKCGGLCKREQKWAEKMNGMDEVNETVDLRLFLQSKQLVPPHHSTLQKAG